MFSPVFAHYWVQQKKINITISFTFWGIFQTDAQVGMFVTVRIDAF